VDLVYAVPTPRVPVKRVQECLSAIRHGLTLQTP
jgi:hypothetical protein